MQSQAEAEERVGAADLADAWPLLIKSERVEGFRSLGAAEAYDFFQGCAALSQAQILSGLPLEERRLWFRTLPPDDAADVLQNVEDEDERAELLQLLDSATRHEVIGLCAYAEDEAGGLMNPRFARLRPQMTVDEAVSYLRRQARDRTRSLFYLYALDTEQRLLGVLSLRELFSAPGDLSIREIMRVDSVTVPEDLDQEEVARVVARSDLASVPVLDAEGRMKGIVTVDDVVDVIDEEATEDIQRLGGMEALDVPYWQTGFLSMLRKRGGWLSLLFVGETLTATAMVRFEEQLAQALVLALFVPLIISSGGNAGSQASTLIVRAMALGEVRSRDALRVAGRELLAGISLGIVLALIGLARILLGETLFQSYGELSGGLAITLALSLLGVVTWGTLVGSVLPFALRALRLDPASASAPLVATLVDVSGIAIYFSIAAVTLS